MSILRRPNPTPPIPSRSHTVVLETVCFRPNVAEQPIVWENKYLVKDYSGEHPYQRSHLKIPVEWTPLDTGGLPRAAALVVKSAASNPPGLILEVAAEVSAVGGILPFYVEIGRLAPGQSLRLRRSRLDDLRIRASVEGGRYDVAVFPE